MRGLCGLLLFGGALLASPLTAQEGADPLADIVSRDGLDGFVTVDRLPVPDAPFLAAGRLVWAGTCENCHGGEKLTGAPKITSTRKWDKRVAKGVDTLAAHAIGGWFGPTYAEMPARGGNADLSDLEVTQAVAFMVWSSGGAEAVTAWLAAHNSGQ